MLSCAVVLLDVCLPTNINIQRYKNCANIGSKILSVQAHIESLLFHLLATDRAYMRLLYNALRPCKVSKAKLRQHSPRLLSIWTLRGPASTPLSYQVCSEVTVEASRTDGLKESTRQ